MKPTKSLPQAARSNAAFSLIELLVVMGIIVTLSALVVPAVTGVQKGNELTNASYGISETFQLARTYAMAHNTYVYVGIGEFDASKPDTTNPQIVAADGKGGRVVLAVASSKDGLPVASPDGSGNPDEESNLDPTKLVAISKARRFESVHMDDLSGKTASDTRPAVSSQYQIGGTSSGTSMAWPVDSSSSGSSKYALNRVVQFDPQGTATLLGAAAGTTTRWMEIGLLPSYGNTVAANTPNFAVLQVCGITGTVRTFRP